jgi:hypothetical protein
MSKVKAITIYVVLLAAAIVLVGYVLNFVPPKTRDYLLVIVLPVAVLWFLFSWYRWHRKQVGHANDLEWLDELLKEHLDGIRDNRKKLEWLMQTIEKEHAPSAALTKRLENVRRILNR